MSLLIVSLSALGWSLFDFSRRKVGESLSPVPAVIGIMLLQTLVNLPWLRWEELSEQAAVWWWAAAASILFNALANVLFVVAVLRAPFTMAVPLLSLTPVFSALVGWVGFSETLGAWEVMGLVTVVLAALFLGWRGEDRALKKSEWLGLGFMTLTAALWAVTPFFDRICTQSGEVGIASYVASQCLGVALVLALVQLARRAGSRGSASAIEIWPRVKSVRLGVWLFVAALAATLGLSFQIQGVQIMHVGSFEAMKRALTLMISLALGRIWLGEKLTLEKLAAVAAMAFGVALASSN
jgi:drug/metabolite transporter (DMT)-like permease